jgi:hypothetical protein
VRLPRAPPVALGVALGASLAAACSGASHPPPAVSVGLLHEFGLRAPDDPTVEGPRILPVTLEKATTWGVEPGGGVRATMAGLRLASWADGVVRAAPGRLPSDPGSVVALPERLGGGFLFAVGPHLWRADAWLSPASPAFTSPFPVADILVGMDRVYARSAPGTLVAFDPRTGQSLDLGPLPPSPHLGRLAAADAWREVAVADFRGALVTLDAGSSWRPLGLPIEPSEVFAMGDVIVVSGPDENRQAQFWAVGRDGQPGRLAEAPSRFAAPEFAPRPLEAIERILRPRPLVAAVEDGWPLVDGTALVLRDGAVARVRLTDGAVVESVLDAFPLNPSRCHPLSLARPGDAGAFGMVCGEPRGRTIVYRWDASHARLVELRRFDSPREVLSFGNGALAVRGSCDPDARDQPEDDEAWCLMPPDGPWREMRFRGPDARLARIVVLSDGRVVLVRPPAGDLSTASLTITDGVHTTQQALKMPVLGQDKARALRVGIWMDGFEERRPGVLGGWVDAAGALVGLEIALDGDVRVGEYIRDESAPVASGRWALGWTASRRGFETTDGGMTWTKGMDLPEPLESSGAVRSRACGPIGCIAAGWLRIGWGPSPEASPPAFPSPRALQTARTPPPLHLDCEPVASARPVEKPSSPPPSTARHAATPPMFVLSLGGAMLYGPGSTSGTVSEFPPFCGRTAPRLRADERGFVVDTSDVDRARRVGGQGVLYAWGPSSGEWDRLGKWEVRWQWPWGGCSSASGPVPWTTLDAARHALGKGIGPPTWWVVAQGDDADHALFIARHTLGVPTADVVEVESARPPVAVRRPGGDPFPEIEGAIRIGGRWYLATAQLPSELAATVVWVLEGGGAREVARVPRAGIDFRAPLHVARRADGHSLGLAVEGQPRIDGPPLLWITSIDLDTGSVGDPEPLALADLSEKAVNLCTGDDVGWRFVMPYPGFVEMDVGGYSTSIKGSLARMRISRAGACLENISAAWDDYATLVAKRQAAPARLAGGGGVRTIDAAILSSGRRFPLLCAQP